MNVNDYLQTLNKFPQCGDICILNHNEVGHVQLLPDDIPVYYDYCDDEISRSEAHELVTWLSSIAIPDIMSYMSSQGYSLIHEDDGSGNGLHYGMLLFRK